MIKRIENKDHNIIPERKIQFGRPKVSEVGYQLFIYLSIYLNIYLSVCLSIRSLQVPFFLDEAYREATPVQTFIRPGI
jgi:hypothetical protein